MVKKTLISFILPVLLLLGNESGNHAAQSPAGTQLKRNRSQGETGTLEKMIVASGSVALGVDVNRLNPSARDTSTDQRPRIIETASSAKLYQPDVMGNRLYLDNNTSEKKLLPKGFNSFDFFGDSDTNSAPHSRLSRLSRFSS
jgi:hypothetical protein